jgi:prepilin-type N-terminal cleavage/methylation domain-containing protein
MHKKGFTLIEVSIVMGIVATLFTLSMISLNTVQQNTYHNTSLDIFLSDIKLQQLKSMSGDTSMTSTFEPHGIYMDSTSYTLFRGASYSAGATGNFTIELNPNLTFSNVEFANRQMVFQKGSGEITGFTNGNDTITITNDVTGKQTVMTLNRYGVITQVQ